VNVLIAHRSDKLRAARRTLGLTQKAFAERLGVDPTTLRKWEQGRALPNIRSLTIIENHVIDGTLEDGRR
jgi:DNA-binding transcriptional regulator YiaG